MQPTLGTNIFDSIADANEEISTQAQRAPELVQCLWRIVDVVPSKRIPDCAVQAGKWLPLPPDVQYIKHADVIEKLGMVGCSHAANIKRIPTSHKKLIAATLAAICAAWHTIDGAEGAALLTRRQIKAWRLFCTLFAADVARYIVDFEQRKPSGIADVWVKRMQKLADDSNSLALCVSGFNRLQASHEAALAQLSQKVAAGTASKKVHSTLTHAYTRIHTLRHTYTHLDTDTH